MPITLLNTLAVGIHEWAKRQGFYNKTLVGDAELFDNPSFTPERLCLIHSEISEALEAWRDEEPNHVIEELADALIRLLDVMIYLGADIDTVVKHKMEENQTRPPMNGRKHG